MKSVVSSVLFLCALQATSLFSAITSLKEFALAKLARELTSKEVILRGESMQKFQQMSANLSSELQSALEQALRNSAEKILLLGYEQIQSLRSCFNSQITDVSTTPSGFIIAGTSSSGITTVWKRGQEPNSRYKIFTRIEHNARMNGVAVAREGRIIILIDSIKLIVCVWNQDSSIYKILDTYQCGKYEFIEVAINNDGSLIGVWARNNEDEMPCGLCFELQENGIKLISQVSSSFRLKQLLDQKTFQNLYTNYNPNHQCCDYVAFHPSLDSLKTITADGQTFLNLWNKCGCDVCIVGRLEPVQSFEGVAEPGEVCKAITPDGAVIVTGLPNGCVNVWQRKIDKLSVREVFDSLKNHYHCYDTRNFRATKKCLMKSDDLSLSKKNKRGYLKSTPSQSLMYNFSNWLRYFTNYIARSSMLYLGSLYTPISTDIIVNKTLPCDNGMSRIWVQCK